ncbi:hypothetical protein ZYGR_0I00630 [Zygosaccharomyces rouxii]|uniref:Genetic interactor of prohibitin 5, mitochondrial n=2 Tax=Zygosaccharomyces rouxii TaxID=4956 RepID=GEP5_ZYGRC|nr:uncharacterized protein ZYRO0C01562g [Zygosaccharomyces rouxii]C5DSN0.1 RecName: Full=Genetic interactor of prohibitin 5, mitochondrial; AltName: Full=Required for respiratory growth protein 5 [Zygosaccharomyces rouxii CBS 732]KAH9202018.1 genetic interactor of prohibitin 5, mitochondrial [Zygosaccharomyces rouxii]GAV47767.1 hypothetical protein ZYGR_0I00630 [Zygosaccharomyces rouxii]CAR26791.1 ZYRO0C01562p [Zygosaccharomyces rouxii]
MVSSNLQELIPALSRSIRQLPLHIETQKVLEFYCRNSSYKSLLVAQDISEFEKHNDHKYLEALIQKTHFLWDNPLPPFLKRFQLYHKELTNHWPYEYQRSLLSMSNPRKESQGYLWRDGKELALSNLRFEKHRWADENIIERLSPEQGTQLLHSIFHQYFFLKSHARLCYNNRKIPVPIVEIPLRPMGNDVADCRIRNLFKRKTAVVWNLLAWENRPLSTRNEQLLGEIITKSETRSMRRLYQRASRRAYVVTNEGKDPNGLQVPEFRPGEILQMSI